MTSKELNEEPYDVKISYTVLSSGCKSATNSQVTK